MRYAAVIMEEGGSVLAQFPDCPGCFTQADKGERIEDQARDALVGWLAAMLQQRRVPPVARKRIPGGKKLLWVDVPPKLAVKVALRQARAEAGLTQAELARRAGVSQPAIAQLEDPDSNPTIDTLEKVASALGARLSVSITRERETAVEWGGGRKE